MDTFLSAVSYVTPPTNMLFYHLRKLFRVCDSKTDFDSTLKTLVDRIYSKISRYSQSNSIQGQIFKKAIGDYESEIKEIGRS